jgi:hypothetical protein
MEMFRKWFIKKVLSYFSPDAFIFGNLFLILYLRINFFNNKIQVFLA